MCLFYADFKHVVGLTQKNFCRYRKVSSIMSANALSIMPVIAVPVTAD